MAEANGWRRLATNSAKLVNIIGGYGYQPVLISMQRWGFNPNRSSAARSSSWRRHPLDNLGICACFPLGRHALDDFNRPLDLLCGHLLNASAVLDFHFPRHQQDKQFQKYRRLVPHHLLYRLATALPEGGVHFPDGVGVKRMTRAMDVAGSVSRHPRSKLSVCGARYLFLGSVSHSNTTPSSRGLE